MLDLVPVPLLRLGRDLCLRHLNRAAERLLVRQTGRSPPSGAALGDLLAGPRPGLAVDMAAAATGGQLGLRLAPGRPPVGAQVAYDPGAGEYVVALSDSSGMQTTLRRLRLEQEALSRSAHLDREARRAAEARNRALEGFSAMAAHDLRQPLRNIRHLLDFLQEDHGHALAPEATDLVGQARDCAIGLAGLVDDLLTYARLGWQEIEMEPVDLDALAGQLHLDFGEELRQQGGALTIPSPLGYVTGAGGLVRVLLSNLVGNAVKYRHPDRAPCVTLARTGGILTVADNGRGFPPEEAEHIFDPFVRLHRGSGAGGTGFGLAVCRAVAERHGWTLTAHGLPGEGATFTLSGLS
ncbi:His Kinase A (phospho-acceptor) domain-containing protein [Wenxinia saemankumensis]|uniref:histidine kinase n=2 Tax=Wenxinia saemankumensis TaxID=1447782 RepID=A0A1M6DYS5_9RHOB|nr:His Kinase A (phospho-acceptor) domain-containing protein [Wenxinia saemankumensis]